ncbi:hypothetical protein CYMTET_9434 [Cymbomonas tetramitiformis]|uniref:Uncharacterized protein n=1 Tax=Cymbomonas tetramitiformis TaxID=36881 RepID=A0AAE0GR25_9CHLO|nr:hypothetical protein CYMTET_9434 [Cymbomonas tetramitiformis]
MGRRPKRSEALSKLNKKEVPGTNLSRGAVFGSKGGLVLSKVVSDSIDTTAKILSQLPQIQKEREIEQDAELLSTFADRLAEAASQQAAKNAYALKRAHAANTDSNGRPILSEYRIKQLQEQEKVHKHRPNNGFKQHMKCAKLTDQLKWANGQVKILAKSKDSIVSKYRDSKRNHKSEIKSAIKLQKRQAQTSKSLAASNLRAKRDALARHGIERSKKCALSRKISRVESRVTPAILKKVVMKKLRPKKREYAPSVVDASGELLEEGLSATQVSKSWPIFLNALFSTGDPSEKREKMMAPSTINTWGLVLGEVLGSALEHSLSLVDVDIPQPWKECLGGIVPFGIMFDTSMRHGHHLMPLRLCFYNFCEQALVTPLLSVTSVGDTSGETQCDVVVLGLDERDLFGGLFHSGTDNTNSMSGRGGKDGKGKGGAIHMLQLEMERRDGTFTRLPRTPCTMHVLHIQYTIFEETVCGKVPKGKRGFITAHPVNLCNMLHWMHHSERKGAWPFMKLIYETFGYRLRAFPKCVATRWEYNVNAFENFDTRADDIRSAMFFYVCLLAHVKKSISTYWFILLQWISVLILRLQMKAMIVLANEHYRPALCWTKGVDPVQHIHPGGKEAKQLPAGHKAHLMPDQSLKWQRRLQVFYGNSNVYSRKNGVKLDEMFWGKTPDVPPPDRMSLQMCNMSSDINLHAAAKVNQMKHVEEIAVVADNVRADLSVEGADPGSILRERFNEWKRLNSSSDLQLREPGCARPLNFAFFMSSQVGSQLIRGFMTSDFIRAAGHSSVSILAKRGAGNPDPLREFRACNRVDVCVFIKWDSRAFPTLVAECKKRGAGVFIDYMDYCQTHQKNVAHFWPTAVDGFIVQSKYQEVFFREINFTKSVAIYHPHTNLDSLQNTVDRPPSVVGYTGHWRNLGASNKEVFDAVQSWGESRGVVFKSIDYTAYKGRGSGRGDIYKQRIYHVAVEGVDIAIVWPSAIIDREVFFKPVTRLVYWWSHGIPTIFYPTQSYAEISLALGYPLAARTTEEVLQWMEKLVESSEFRQTVSKIGIEGAKLFGMEGSAGQYLSAFSAVDLCAIHYFGHHEDDPGPLIIQFNDFLVAIVASASGALDDKQAKRQLLAALDAGFYKEVTTPPRLDMELDKVDIEDIFAHVLEVLEKVNPNPSCLAH